MRVLGFVIATVAIIAAIFTWMCEPLGNWNYDRNVIHCTWPHWEYVEYWSEQGNVCHENASERIKVNNGN